MSLTVVVDGTTSNDEEDAWTAMVDAAFLGRPPPRRSHVIGIIGLVVFKFVVIGDLCVRYSGGRARPLYFRRLWEAICVVIDIIARRAMVVLLLGRIGDDVNIDDIDDGGRTIIVLPPPDANRARIPIQRHAVGSDRPSIVQFPPIPAPTLLGLHSANERVRPIVDDTHRDQRR